MTPALPTPTPVPTTERITPQDVQRYLAAIQHLCVFGKSLAALTSTTYDDRAIAFVEKVVAIVQPYAAEPWFADVLDWLLTKASGSSDLKQRLQRLMKE